MSHTIYEPFSQRMIFICSLARFFMHIWQERMLHYIMNEIKPLTLLVFIMGVKKCLIESVYSSIRSVKKHGLKGQCVLVPADMEKIQTSLSRACNDDLMISPVLKRRLNDSNYVVKKVIRPDLVNHWFLWYKYLSRVKFPHRFDSVVLIVRT